MTYDRAPPLLGLNPLPVDMLALEFIYGGSDQANLGNDSYFIDPLLFDTGQYYEGRMSLLTTVVLTSSMPTI